MDELRSYLRTREAWFRKHPIDDAHVKLYQKLRLKLFNETKRQQAMWTCPKCQKTIRAIDRNRDNSGHLSKHCGCSVLPTRSMTPDQLADHKRNISLALKTKYRREAGAIPMVEIAARAEAKREEKKSRRRPVLHDAHVKRYSYLFRARLREAEKYFKEPEKCKARNKKRRDNLNDSYVIQNITAMGIQKDLVTPELISIKREAMQYRRMSKTIKTTVKTHLKEENETITKHP